MAARSPRRREAVLAFDALHIEGGLLAPEWLTRVSRLDAPDQAEADYRIPKGLNLRDEIGRSWRIAQAHHEEYRAGLARKADAAGLSARFVRALLRDVLGFTSLAPVAPLVVGERTYPIGHAALGGRVPVVIAPAGAGLDTPHADFGEGGRRRSPFGLLQEALNATDAALWGLVCDGDRLRVARDNASLTRPAWIEADIARIFAEERFADFTALWLLVHETRFGAESARPEDCPLEAWREAGRQEGTRALGQLRVGVKDALEALGQGFLAHPDNHALRAALEEGRLSRRDLFQQLLRLAYRLIFLLTVEERDLLHPPRTSAAVRGLYADGYGLRRLRERAARRSAHDRHDDLWEAQKVALRGLDQGEPRLGLPALGGLFAARQCPDLDAARLHNRHLLQAVFRLAWMRDAAGLARVNWRDMGPEELGSVYESLLELEPEVSVSARRFSFSDGAAGNARKTTGSYYTPDSLVQVLLDSAFEPVVQDSLAAHPDRPAEALLSLAIVDPACGSGHFLLAAARRLAAHVARVEADGTPSAADYRRALRRVVGRCIYGVDLNPMAVELCKVALWMEAVEPGLPLGFLDAHVRCGNALLGATPELMEQGIPDDAWTALEGDDKKVASGLKRRNKAEATGQQTMVSVWSKTSEDEARSLRDAVAALEAAPDGDANSLAKKEARWAELQASEAWRRQHLVADAWCAAFMWPMPEGGGAVTEAAPTNAVWRDLRDGRGAPPPGLVDTVEKIAAAQRFFHWHLAFPTVFERGGFDVVLGNPPFGGQLREQTAISAKEHQVHKNRFPDCVGAYTDPSALFLTLAADVTRDGGCTSLVQPVSLFSTDGASGVRKRLAHMSSFSHLWMTTDAIFSDASVRVCAPTLRKQKISRCCVCRSFGNRFELREPIVIDMSDLASEPTWGHLVADMVGVPRLGIQVSGKIRDIASTTADFRQHFYGLAPYVTEAPADGFDLHAFPKLIVTGLVDPARCLWGERACKFNKVNWARPVVDARRLISDPEIGAWGRTRLTPKIIVATQSKVVEAIADIDGTMLNTVPTITVKPHEDSMIWLVLAVMLSPTAAVWAMSRSLGSALDVKTIKLTAKQVGEIPLPMERNAWAEAAEMVRRASASQSDEAYGFLKDAGELMCRAYGHQNADAFSWWLERMGSAEQETEHIDAD
ncbi:N-6 DNA methylase [Myxococcota bacterium]|nr:N-6 DNA methylase [Myxococcota bacterium]